MILYEDAQLVVCCKPRGVLSAADSSGQESMAALLAPRTVFPVHRLDRDVPGVMVFAKTREAAAFLSAHLTAGKEYLALAEGAPCKEPEELYDLLFHDRARNKTYVVRRTRAGVREARLICTPLRLLPDGRAALHLQLLTGRTHQIRVHFAALGHPLLGDARYGGDASLLARPALHSAAADLTQPVTGQLLHITAPVPDDLRVFGFERYL